MVEGGIVTDRLSTPEYRDGLEVENRLHDEVKEFVRPRTKFCELYEFSNDLISSLGYVNLDFLGNVGHSIATDLNDREFVDAHNDKRLEEVPLFTFEPHICRKNGLWGFKHENIYRFGDDGLLVEL